MPVVAVRCATATPPSPCCSPATARRRFSRLPTERTESIWSPAMTEIPAES
jgi:hypothetical protein